MICIADVQYVVEVPVEWPGQQSCKELIDKLDGLFMNLTIHISGFK